MKSFGPLIQRWSCRVVAALVIGMLACASAASAQQTSSGKKKSPSLTTEDVMRPAAAAEQATDVAAAKVEGDAKADPGKTQAEGAKASPEEAAWREQMKTMRERAKATERAAEEGELRVTEIRNNLGISGQSPKYRNETAAELERAGKRLTELRAQARAAASELKSLIEHGRLKGFTEAPELTSPADEGKPDEQYYRAKFAALNEALQTAERRIQLYENRIREKRERLNNPSVDRFAAAQMREELDESQEQLEQAHAARAKAQSDMAALVEEARRAGVGPGTFR